MATPTGVLRADITPTMAKLNYVVKAALVASFAVAIIVPPDAVAGKAMGFGLRCFSPRPCWFRLWPGGEDGSRRRLASEALGDP